MGSTVEPQISSTASDAQQATLAPVTAQRAKVQWLWRVIHFSPFAVLVWFVAHFAVNVPIADDWPFAYFFHAIKFKTASFGDWFALANEHRLFFPKLIWTPLAFATHWNLIAEALLDLVFVWIVFVVFYRIACRQRRHDGLLNLANFATSLFLFSLVQYETWLLGILGALLLVHALLALAIAVCFAEKLRSWGRFSLAALFCFVASFSMLQGLVTWLALLPCIAQLETAGGKIRKLYAWLFLFVVSVVLYSYHFKPAVWAANAPSSSLSHPVQTASFFLALLGAPFGQGQATVSASAVCLMGALILVAVLSCLLLVRGREPREVTAPWLTVALFGLFYTAMVTMGRSSFGPGVAYQTRYISGTILVSIAAVQLGRIACARRGAQLYTFLVGAFCALMIFGSISSIAMARELKEERLEAKAFLELIRYIDPATDSSKESRLFPLFGPEGYTGWIRTPAELLNELGFLHLASHANFVEHSSTEDGLFESADGSGDLLHLRGKDQITVTGWAAPAERRGVRRLILISYNDHQTFITGAVVGGVMRSDVAARKQNPRYARTGWKVSFPAKFLPRGEGVLKAWVYDSAENKFVRLPESGGEKRFRIESQ